MTEQDWEDETTDVSEVHAHTRDTEPAPPPTEPTNEPPPAPDACTCTFVQLEAFHLAHFANAAATGERCPRCGGIVQ